MRRPRVTVSVRPEVLEVAQAAVAAGEAPSLSAWVDAAMEEKSHRESLKRVLEEIRAELGPPTEDETAWARSVLGL